MREQGTPLRGESRAGSGVHHHRSQGRGSATAGASQGCGMVMEPGYSGAEGRVGTEPQGWGSSL